MSDSKQQKKQATQNQERQQRNQSPEGYGDKKLKGPNRPAE
ncbi:hypothetical protein [Desertibacillus haloalkaliphilus]|nr:hypothetical protein [Desertibacillus haloalkaliphilus]